MLESGEAEAVGDRHEAWFLSTAERAEPQLRGRDQLTWGERLKADHDNLRAALSWSAQGAEPLLGLRLATALRFFWYAHGHLREGRDRKSRCRCGRRASI